MVRAHNNGMATEHSGGSFPTWAGASAHSSYTLLGAPDSARAPPAALYASHQDWFWPRDSPTTYGQLCWHNEDLIEYLISQARAMLRAAKTQPGPPARLAE